MVTVRAADGAAIVEIADTGIGLSPELIERAFDMFVQGKVVNRAKGGLGIGLAVVQSLAKLHGGQLTAHSPGINGGSTFALRFPLADAVPAAPSASGPAPGGTARILVIEDNQDVREMMSLMLSELGFAVRVAVDGESGVQAATSFQPDVALVDIDLPDISGHDVARRLRNEPVTARIKLVAVTGYGQVTDQQDALAAGFDRHLAKPVPIEILLGVIDDLTGLAAGAARGDPPA
jgi:two-component system, sensor histidine kinase